MEVRRMNETNSKNKKGMSMKGQRTLAYIVLLLPVLVLCTVYQCHQIQWRTEKGIHSHSRRTSY